MHDWVVLKPMPGHNPVYSAKLNRGNGMVLLRALGIGLVVSGVALGNVGIRDARADGMPSEQKSPEEKLPEQSNLEPSYEQGAGQFISDLANKTITQLAEPEINLEERKARFRKILEEGFAVEAIGKWVLGRYWRQLDEDQQRRYLALFEDLMVDTYAPKFGDYSGEELNVLNTIELGKNDMLVRSHITTPEAQREPIKVDWRVRSKSGRFYIVDIMIEGISMGQTQRSEFASVIRNKGGKVEALLSELSTR